MILSNKIRTDFVNAVLADIKTGVDDDAVRKMVADEAIAALPPAVRALYDNEATRGYVATTQVNFDRLDRSAPRPPDQHHYYGGWSVPGIGIAVPGARSYKASARVKAQFEKLQRESEAKLDAKDAMKIRLTAMAGSCKTVEALKALLPHLAKYMPEPPPKQQIYAVPAVQVNDLMKDLKKLGVPGKKEAVAA